MPAPFHMVPDHREQNVDHRPFDAGGQRLRRGAAAHGRRRGGQLGEGVQPGREAAQRHHGKPVAVVNDTGLDGMTAHPLVALSVGGMLRRRERGAWWATHHRRFFPRARARSMLLRWTEMAKRSRTSSTSSAAVSSGCSFFAVCNASTTSSLSL